MSEISTSPEVSESTKRRFLDVCKSKATIPTPPLPLDPKKRTAYSGADLVTPEGRQTQILPITSIDYSYEEPYEGEDGEAADIRFFIEHEGAAVAIDVYTLSLNTTSDGGSEIYEKGLGALQTLSNDISVTSFLDNLQRLEQEGTLTPYVREGSNRVAQ